MGIKLKGKKIIQIIIGFSIIMLLFLIYLKNQPVDMKGWSLFQVKEYAIKNEIEIEYETVFSATSFGEVINNERIDENKYRVLVSIGEDLTNMSRQYVEDYIANLKVEGYIEQIEEIPIYFDEEIPRDNLKKYEVELIDKKIILQYSNGTDPIITNISFVGVGDVLLHNNLIEKVKAEDNDKLEISYDFDSLFNSIKPYIENSVLSLVNQVSITGGNELAISGDSLFNSPFSITDSLVNVGFNLFANANRHSFDFGENAIANAKNYYDSFEGVVNSGINLENTELIPIIEINDLKVAFLSYTHSINKNLPQNKDYLVNVFSEQKANKDIEKAKEIADIIIVSMYWDAGNQTTITDIQKQQAQWLADKGVNLIIGNTGESLQPVEYLSGIEGNQTFVAYSLGNFLTGYENTELMIGGLLQLNISHIQKMDGTEIVIDNIKILPIISNITTFEIIPLIDSEQKELFSSVEELLKSLYQDIEVIEK